MKMFFAIRLVGLCGGMALAASDDRSSESPGLLDRPRALHVGIVVADLEKAVDHWTRLLGLAEAPNIIVGKGHEDNPTHYRGEPSDVEVRLAFFNLENIQIELLSPLGNEANHWSEFLAHHGPGVHHLAFEVKGIGEVYVDRLRDRGISIVQQGGWDGGEYLYTDTHAELGVTLELLENYAREAP